jgi:uncharacterized membrane protein
MNEQPTLPTTPVAPPQGTDSTTTAQVVYGLYLASLLLGFTSIIGVIVAYVYRGEAQEWLKAHYTLQIRTFWIGLLYSFAAGLLSLVGIGLILIPVVLVWLIVRCVKGFQYLGKRQPYPNVDTWFW